MDEKTNYSSARARSINGDLTKGEWLGSECPFCGTIIGRAQPHMLRESNQGIGGACLNCGRPAVVRWGKITCARNPDGTHGVYFEPRQPDRMPPPDDEPTKKIHIDAVTGQPKSTK